MSSTINIVNLIVRFLRNLLTEREQKELDVWKYKSVWNSYMFEKLTDEREIIKGLFEIYQINKEEGWKRVETILPTLHETLQLESEKRCEMNAAVKVHCIKYKHSSSFTEEEKPDELINNKLSYDDYLIKDASSNNSNVRHFFASILAISVQPIGSNQ